MVSEIDINTTGWHSIKKMCNKCGEESETQFNPEAGRPPIDHFPCECGAYDFTELTKFSGEV